MSADSTECGNEGCGIIEGISGDEIEMVVGFVT
jgi:hypothetical protein